ncbi:TIGR01906 family membrane protein [Liquorilactobacillus oeni]|uniref:Intergral membrane protein n=1 Tax=Liquorilactobacillus oeni DSM 19972 TaxID=1423777 RepID=A0A0R1M7C4_9LACO|nr:TIGR01906 family membrane protein [Liquorilactobacillus oeni]KRL03990.1 intergral membrane protein [Liquorilactobacillus oeni DSM 19972]
MSGSLKINKEGLIWLLWLICLFLFFISISITVTINFVPLYHVFVIQEHLGARAGMSNAKLMNEYRTLLHFLNYPWISELHLAFPMSYNGLQHFYDVKNLFLVNYLVLLITAPLSCFRLSTIWKKKQQWRLIAPFQNFILIIVGVVILMFLNFNAFFVSFHELLFRNSDWIFDPQLDPIINVLPDTFFLSCFGLFFLLLLSFLTAGIISGKRSLK